MKFSVNRLTVANVSFGLLNGPENETWVQFKFIETVENSKVFLSLVSLDSTRFSLRIKSSLSRDIFLHIFLRSEKNFIHHQQCFAVHPLISTNIYFISRSPSLLPPSSIVWTLTFSFAFHSVFHFLSLLSCEFLCVGSSWQLTGHISLGCEATENGCVMDYLRAT